MPTLVDEAIECLAAKGGRMTAQRRLILETLDNLSGHPTAEELYEQLRPKAPDLNLSTVYRTLRWLEKEGLVGTRWFGPDRQDRFDLASPAEHHHFVCTSCQQVIEFNSRGIERLKKQFEKDYGAEVDFASVTLYGQCPDCAGTENLEER
jgi:Fe2+ or Zn2+ uptake regulation protein